jgi:hypothetical protein
MNKLLEKPVKNPGFSVKSKETVPKIEVLEQPQVVDNIRSWYILPQGVHRGYCLWRIEGPVPADLA